MLRAMQPAMPRGRPRPRMATSRHMQVAQAWTPHSRCLRVWMDTAAVVATVGPPLRRPQQHQRVRRMALMSAARPALPPHIAPITVGAA